MADAWAATQEAAPAMHVDLRLACAIVAVAQVLGLTLQDDRVEWLVGRFREVRGVLEYPGLNVGKPVFQRIRQARSNRRRFHSFDGVGQVNEVADLAAEIQSASRTRLERWAKRYLSSEAALLLPTDLLQQLILRIRPLPEPITRWLSEYREPFIFKTPLPNGGAAHRTVVFAMQRLAAACCARYSVYRPLTAEQLAKLQEPSRADWWGDLIRASGLSEALTHKAMHSPGTVSRATTRIEKLSNALAEACADRRHWPRWLESLQSRVLYVRDQCANCREHGRPTLVPPTVRPPFGAGCSCVHVEWAPESLTGVSEGQRATVNLDWRWQRFLLLWRLNYVDTFYSFGPLWEFFEDEQMRARQRRTGERVVG